MSFSQRVAVIAAISLSMTGLAGSSTGLAAQLNQTINAALPAAVPTTPLPATPALQPAIVTTTTPDPLQPQAKDAIDDGNGDYASLSEAVAAQNPSLIPDEDTRCLAGAIYFEAKGEPLSGQLAVADVILNRTKSGRFPKSVCSVVTQPGQFAFVRGGRVPDIGANGQYRTAVAVAKVALAEAWDSPAEGAMYFHARRVSPGWHRTKVAAIGNHLFYR